MARCRKAVYSALWVQLVLLACYLPVSVVATVIGPRQANLSHFVVALGIANTLVYLNSTLNPFLYCWKISEVRQAMKQTIRKSTLLFIELILSSVKLILVVSKLVVIGYRLSDKLFKKKK